MIDDMPKPRPQYVHREITRHGRIVWYYQPPGKGRRRIHGTFGSADWQVSYEAARDGKSGTRPEEIASKESLMWLVEQWQQSSNWYQTSEATKRQRANILKTVIARSNNPPFSTITESKIFEGRESRMTTPAAANNFLKTMRSLFKWAKNAKHVSVDPAKDVEFLTVKTEGHEPWNFGDVDAYRARWPLGTKERVAMEVILWTGLRRGDAVRVGWQHIKDGMLRIRTEKTPVDVSIGVSRALAETLGAGPTGDLALIVGNSGKPMTKEVFGNSFRVYCREAGIDKSAHGLRKLAATIAAEKSASESELRNKFGWLTNSQSIAYTRSAAADKLAKTLADKIETGNLFSHPRKGAKTKGIK